MADLVRMVERDLADAAIPQLSTDRRLATAYNAALLLATIALHAAGYRTASTGHHWPTFHVLPEVLGIGTQARADYLDGCRAKRNVSDYDRAGAISEQELAELVEEVQAFRQDILGWLYAHHADLCPR